MTPALLFGLLAALCYGASSLVARLSGRASGVLPTLFWSQLILLALAAVVFSASGDFPRGHAVDWIILIGTDLAIIAATACLYRGLAVGRVSIVAPVMASYGAVSAVLAWSIGEDISPMAIGGLALTIAGAILSAVQKDDSQQKKSGLGYAAASALLFGLGYWAQGTFVLPTFGAVSTVFLYYLGAALVFGLSALILRANLRTFDNAKEMGLMLATAGLSGGGFAATLLAQTDGDVAIATAVSSASTAITVILALIFLKDRPSRTGWAGVVAVVGGVMLLQLASG